MSDSAQVTVPEGSTVKHLVSNNLGPEEVVQFVKRLLTQEEEQAGAKNLEPGDAKAFVELLDELLTRERIEGREKSPCIRYLARVCGWHSILPESAQISGHERIEEYSGGGFSIVWTGKHNNQQVAIKALRFYASYNEEKKRGLTRAFCKEVVIWKYLNHPNILPFIGAAMVTEKGLEKYEIVSEFMENGEITGFIEKNRDANRPELLKDIALGLSYLHSRSVVHGDLKGRNVLIDKYGRARLADFGLNRVLAECASSGPDKPGGTHLYMSPEILQPERYGCKDARPTKESDIYALGIVIFEVICGNRPYPEIAEYMAVIKFEQGEFPPRPNVGFTDSLWETMEGCWQTERGRRPNVDTVLAELDTASRA